MIESFNEMRKGKIVNASEHRSALHTSLRDPSPDAPHAAEVHQTLEAFCKFAEDVQFPACCRLLHYMSLPLLHRACRHYLRHSVRVSR